MFIIAIVFVMGFIILLVPIFLFSSITKRKGTRIILYSVGSLLAAFLVLVTFVSYRQSAGTITLNQQLQRYITDDNPKVLISLASDQATKNYLLRLPKNAKVSKFETNDDIGPFFIEKGFYYLLFSTKIDKTPVLVLMKEDLTTPRGRLLPKWTLIKVSIDGETFRYPPF